MELTVVDKLALLGAKDYSDPREDSLKVKSNYIKFVCDCIYDDKLDKIISFEEFCENDDLEKEFKWRSDIIDWAEEFNWKNKINIS